MMQGPLRLGLGGALAAAESAASVGRVQRALLAGSPMVSGPATATLRMAQWWHTMARRNPPQWASPHRILTEGPLVRLRDFSQPGDPDGPATLVLPPQAGHDSCIVDFAPGQSQVQALRDAGLPRVVALDWRGATYETRNATIADYVEALDQAVGQLGGCVNLVGDCQGGWLAAIYAAVRPAQVNTLTIAGAPIDFHAGSAAVHDWLSVLGQHDLAFYRSVVAAHGGRLPGWFLLAGFIGMRPQQEVDRQLGLILQLDDPEAVSRYRAFEDWFKHTQDLPGAFYLWIVEQLFRDNLMIKGELTIDGDRVDLGAIRCPVVMLAGADDHISPAAQVFALADAVSSPPADRHSYVVPGGHLGLFMGRAALQEHWPLALRHVTSHG